MSDKPKPSDPWTPADYTLADVSAIQAMTRGEASPQQQLRALEWIVKQVCGTYDEPYRPESERDTNYALGKQYVGRTIVKATTLSINALKARSPEPGDRS